MNIKRIMVGILLGAFLGIFCIIGASLRSSSSLDGLYLFSFWYNRVIMGLAIGLAAYPKNVKIALIRGALIGLLVSFAFYSSTQFNDMMGFLAGIVYGVIIDVSLFSINKLKQ